MNPELNRDLVARIAEQLPPDLRAGRWEYRDGPRTVAAPLAEILAELAVDPDDMRAIIEAGNIPGYRRLRPLGAAVDAVERRFLEEHYP